MIKILIHFICLNNTSSVRQVLSFFFTRHRLRLNTDNGTLIQNTITLICRLRTVNFKLTDDCIMLPL